MNVYSKAVLNLILFEVHLGFCITIKQAAFGLSWVILRGGWQWRVINVREPTDYLNTKKDK